jgi:hypothetical protein
MLIPLANFSFKETVFGSAFLSRFEHFLIWALQLVALLWEFQQTIAVEYYRLAVFLQKGITW